LENRVFSSVRSLLSGEKGRFSPGKERFSVGEGKFCMAIRMFSRGKGGFSKDRRLLFVESACFATVRRKVSRENTPVSGESGLLSLEIVVKDPSLLRQACD
jgi:hypothetical protein